MRQRSGSDSSVARERLMKAMKLSEVQQVLEAEIVSSTDVDSVDVTICCAADLMSDVLAQVEPGALLLTGLTNPQVVRTAEMANVIAVCFVRGKRPQAETVALAESKGLPLLATGLPMFESCGRLYREGLAGCFETSR